MLYYKVDLIVNGNNSKSNLFKLKLLLQHLNVFNLRVRNKYFNQFISLDSPFHYKVPKSNLGIFGYKISFYLFFSPATLPKLFQKLS